MVNAYMINEQKAECLYRFYHHGTFKKSWKTDSINALEPGGSISPGLYLFLTNVSTASVSRGVIVFVVRATGSFFRHYKHHIRSVPLWHKQWKLNARGSIHFVI